MYYELPEGPNYELPEGKMLPVLVEFRYDINLPAPGSKHDDCTALVVAEKLGLIRDPNAPLRKHIYTGSVTSQELAQLQDRNFKWCGHMSTSRFVVRVSQSNHRPQWERLADGEHISGAGLSFRLRFMQDIGSFYPLYVELYLLSTEGWQLRRREKAGLLRFDLDDTANIRICYEQLRLHAEELIDLESMSVGPDAFAALAAE